MLSLPFVVHLSPFSGEYAEKLPVRVCLGNGRYCLKKKAPFGLTRLGAGGFEVLVPVMSGAFCFRSAARL